MKKLALVVLFIFTLSGFVMADEPTDSKVEVTFPMETAAVGFWFPESGVFAAGMSHAVMRISHEDLAPVTLDLDVSIAQEINEAGDTMMGLGVKLNFPFVEPTNDDGLAFVPSLGLTALNNFEEFSTIDDILDNYEIAVYGTVLIYQW